MLSKLSSAYLCAFVWNVSRFMRGAKPPKEKWAGYIGDAIWQFSFFFTAASFFIVVMPFAAYSPHPIVGASNGDVWLLSITHYFLVIIFHYYFIRFRVGYAFIYEKLFDEEYLAQGRRSFMWVAVCTFSPMLFWVAVMMFRWVQG